MTALLASPNPFEREQAVDILRILLHPIKPLSLSTAFMLRFCMIPHMSSSQGISLPQRLVDCVAQIENSQRRLHGTNVFHTWYKALSYPARHKFLIAMLQSCINGNALYLIMMWIKDDILATRTQFAAQKYFTGPHLRTLMFAVMSYNNGASPLLEFDRWMAALNLCRFTLLFGRGAVVEVRLPQQINNRVYSYAIVTIDQCQLNFFF